MPLTILFELFYIAGDGNEYSTYFISFVKN